MTTTERQNLSERFQDAKLKIKNLQKLNSELIRTLGSMDVPQYKQLLNRLSEQQSSSSQTISMLNLKISQLQTELQFNSTRLLSIISDLQQKLQNSSNLITRLKESLSQALNQNSQLKKQFQIQKSMIKNQEQLIDDYKKSMEEQKQIQSQISKCEIKSIESKLKREMQQQVSLIKNKYQKKIQQINQEKLSHSYQREIQILGNYITDKKKHLHSSITLKKQTGCQPINVQSGIIDNNSSNLFETQLNKTKQFEISSVEHLTKGQKLKPAESLGSTLESVFHNFKSNTNRSQNKINFQSALFNQININNLPKPKEQNENSNERNPLQNISNYSTYSRQVNLFAKIQTQPADKIFGDSKKQKILQ